MGRLMMSPPRREVFRNTALVFAAALSADQRSAEALTNLLAGRLEEILPADDFEVEARLGVLNIRGVGRFQGSSTVSTPALVLAISEGSWEERLGAVFMTEGENLQDFLTHVYGEPWPARDATPHVCVTAEDIRLWWGGPTEDDASMKLRPISRQELET
jgi:hypothetical protein